jgi:hypothetical protein
MVGTCTARLPWKMKYEIREVMYISEKICAPPVNIYAFVMSARSLLHTYTHSVKPKERKSQYIGHKSL